MSLSKADVLKILSSKLKDDAVVLCSYTLETLNANGMMGEHLQLTCKVQAEGGSQAEHRFFVKKRSPREEINLLTEIIFRKEKAANRLFKEINLPLINDSLPRCFYDDDQHLVFEDLLVEGYVLQTPHRVATEEELLVVLKSLAGIHAGAIVYEERQSKPNQLHEVCPQIFQELYLCKRFAFTTQYHQSMVNGLKTAIRMCGLPEVLSSGKRFDEEVERFMELLCDESTPLSSDKFRNTLCHCDLSPPNIFIRYDADGKPKQVKIVDHQMSRYLPPAHDVLVYILLSTSGEQREKNLHKLKLTYYEFFANYLQENGVDALQIYTLEEFLDSFKHVEFFALFVALHIITLVYIPDQSVGEIINSELKMELLFEDRSPLLTKFAHNEYFMGRIKDCLLDLKAYFERN